MPVSLAEITAAMESGRKLKLSKEVINECVHLPRDGFVSVYKIDDSYTKHKTIRITWKAEDDTVRSGWLYVDNNGKIKNESADRVYNADLFESVERPEEQSTDHLNLEDIVKAYKDHKKLKLSREAINYYRGVDDDTRLLPEHGLVEVYEISDTNCPVDAKKVRIVWIADSDGRTHRDWWYVGSDGESRNQSTLTKAFLFESVEDSSDSKITDTNINKENEIKAEKRKEMKMKDQLINGLNELKTSAAIGAKTGVGAITVDKLLELFHKHCDSKLPALWVAMPKREAVEALVVPGVLYLLSSVIDNKYARKSMPALLMAFRGKVHDVTKDLFATIEPLFKEIYSTLTDQE